MFKANNTQIPILIYFATAVSGNFFNGDEKIRIKSGIKQSIQIKITMVYRLRDCSEKPALRCFKYTSCSGGLVTKSPTPGCPLRQTWDRPKRN